MKNKTTIFSWVIYDFANTIFSMNVISVYFPLWITENLMKDDLFVSYATTISMIMLILSAPLLGSWADKKRNTRGQLVIFTMLSIFGTACLAFTNNLFTGLLLFIVANFSFQAALIFYNSFLVKISTPKNIGKISGWGVGVGYIGSIFGMLMVLPFVKSGLNIFGKNFTGNQASFLPTALFYFLFSIPAFIFLKNRKRAEAENTAGYTVQNQQLSVFQLWHSLKKAFKNRNVRYFLIARVIYMDAVNTLILFMAIFSTKVMGFSSTSGSVQNFLIISTIFAFIGGAGSGYVADKIGPFRTLKFVIILWIFVLGLITVNFSLPLYWILGGLAGMALGGSWTADRPLLINMVDKEELNEYFSLYSMTGKIATIIGPMIWGLTVKFIPEKNIDLNYRSAVFLLFLFTIISYFFLAKLKLNPKKG